jgi:hypothetical protein
MPSLSHSPKPLPAKKTATQPELQEKKGRIERIGNWVKRHYLAIPITAGAIELAAATGGYMAYRAYNKEVETRTAEVINLNDFLNGKADPKLKLDIYGTPTTYRQLRDMIFETFFVCYKQPCSSMDSAELSSMLDSFAKMIMVEDVFGYRVNTLPIIDRMGYADSYGYGQINPFTAFDALKRKEKQLSKYLPDLPKKLAAIDAKMKSGHKYGNHELAVELDLMGPSNIIPALIYFNEANILYSEVHVIEGGVAGEPSFNEHVTINPRENQRALSLTVAAYSAKMTSPAVAKLQTAINDVILFDKATAKKLGLPEKTLTVDGDMGALTEDCIRRVEPLSSQDHKKVIDIVKDKSGKLPNIELISLFANDISDSTQMALRSASSVKKGLAFPFLSMDEILSATEMRYGATIAIYDLLKKKVPQKNARTFYELFMSYVKTRDPGFFSLLKNPATFALMFPAYDYGQFHKDAAAAYRQSVLSDMKYRGVIPTAYAPGKNLHDPKNPMERVIDAHKFFGNKIFDEPFKL